MVFMLHHENGMHIHISTYKALEIDKSELFDKSILIKQAKIEDH